MRKLFLPVSLLLLALLVAAIPKSFKVTDLLSAEPILPSTPYPYDGIFFGFHFFEDSIEIDAYNPSDNLITNEGATLGRVLFYDTRLSENHTISCASCHLPEFGFSDSARLSEGFDGEFTHRNSMGLANARMQPLQRFFWDATEDTLRHQVKTALTSLVEMGMDMDTMVNRLQATTFYPALYADAFGDPNITQERTFAAIGQFVRSMVSFNSRYDIGAFMTFDRHATFPNFTAQENLGKTLFFSQAVGCANCHASHNFITPEPFNNGLDHVYADQGLGEQTGLASDMGLFKAPPLRNIELTGPYMHDGRFNTLEEVVEHYNSGVKLHSNLSPLLRENGLPKRLNLSQHQKNALVAFLKTLSDPYFLTDPRWQDPFKVAQADPILVTPIDSLILGIPLGVQQADLRENAEVFPNPAVESFTVAFPNPNGDQVRVILHELNGRQVRNVLTDGRSVEIERGDLAAGTYLVRVHRPHDGFMTKVVLR